MKKGELIVVNKKEISIKNMGYILKQARLKMGYLFHLKEGRHVIRMEVVLGDLAPILTDVQASLRGWSVRKGEEEEKHTPPYLLSRSARLRKNLL